MLPIQLPEDLYDEVRRLATASGFETVDAFVTEVVQVHLLERDGNFDHRFTSEVVDHIQVVAAKMDSGAPTFSEGDLDELLEQNRSA